MNAPAYDYSRAAALDSKARRLRAMHRRHVFDDDTASAERHGRALRRIGRLMGPHWRAEHAHRAGNWMLTAYA